MARLNTIEPIRYTQSLVSTELRGLLRTKSGTGIDCTGMKAVDGFVLKGIQPAGTERRVVFLVDDVWYRIEPDGSLLELMEQSLSADSVLAEGNSVEELEEINSVPGMVGKFIGIAAALAAPDADAVMPTLGIGVKCRSAQPVTSRVELSPVYELAKDSRIVKLSAKTEQENGGSALVEARITQLDNTLSEWGSLESFAGKKANAVQFRASLSVTQIGVSVAKVESVAMEYRSGDDILSGVGAADLVSITRDWYVDVRDCRLTVRHAPLVDATLRGYCAIRDRSSVSRGERLGLGTGEKKTYQLQNTDGVAYDSVKVYVDGTQLLAGYEVNSEVGRVTLSAPDGALITADYAYGWTEERWLDMPRTGTVQSLDHDRTEFKLTLPKSEDGRSICAVRLELETTDGRAEGEVLGTGTGRTQLYLLSHTVKDGQIRIRADGEDLPGSAWSLKDDAAGVWIAAPAGAELTADYDWISETPQVKQFVAVFGE